MSTLAAHTATPAIDLTPSNDRAASIAQYIGHILAGAPYRDGLRPVAPAVRRPATVREGIEWILAGPGH